MASSIDIPVAAEPPRVVTLEAGRSEKNRPAVNGAKPEAGQTVARIPLATRESVTLAVDKVREFVQVVRRDLEFSVDEATGRTIITVLDSESGEVVRQIPPEEIMTIAENLEEVQGILFQGQA